MKFLCDAMLGHVGRKLRMAGYDTVIDKGQRADAELLRQANEEARIFLTCDRGIPANTAAAPTATRLILSTNDENTWARKLAEKLGVDWTYRPFSRCLDCNTELQTAPNESIEKIPTKSRNIADEILYCNRCDKVFWFGSHTGRMQQQLESLKQLR